MLEKHGDHFLQVGLELIEAASLAMGTRKAMHITHQQSRIGATLNHSGKRALTHLLMPTIYRTHSDAGQESPTPTNPAYASIVILLRLSGSCWRSATLRHE